MDLQEKIKKAISFQKEGNFSEAEKLYSEILDEEPNNANALNLLGLLKYQQKNYDDAVKFLTKAVSINPSAYFYDNLGRIYLEKDETSKSIECHKKAIEINPEKFDYWFNYAMALRKNNQPYEVIEAYNKAISINPNVDNIYCNLGNLYFYDFNDPQTATTYFEKAAELDSSDPIYTYMLAESYFKSKQYEKGITNMEIRISKSIGILSRRMVMKENLDSRPIYNGEDATDKTIYVYYEAAFGDTIMYLRYLPILKEKCKKIIFKPQNSLVELTKDAGYDIEVIDYKTDENTLKFDYHLPLMSIPYALKLFEEKDIPFKDKYLKANPEKVQDYKEKYFNNDKLKIGIKWQGNAEYDKNRKIPLSAFYKLFDLKNTQFYSVQKGEGSEELEEAKDYNIIDLGDTFNDFSDTAAAIENLDLVICNDTSVAHLAGALGKPCLMLLPYMQNWRWTTDLSYCIWYDSVKMFKQNTPGNWDEVFEQIHSYLLFLKKK